MKMPTNMPWALARQTAREAAKPLDAVEVEFGDALGLALAGGVHAFASQPSCDTSAMDGYAVAGSGPWAVVGRVGAGDPVPGVRLGAGEAFAVATGAPVPDGSDLVIPVEKCSVVGERLHAGSVVGERPHAGSVEGGPLGAGTGEGTQPSPRPDVGTRPSPSLDAGIGLSVGAGTGTQPGATSNVGTHPSASPDTDTDTDTDTQPNSGSEAAPQPSATSDTDTPPSTTSDTDTQPSTTSDTGTRSSASTDSSTTSAPSGSQLGRHIRRRGEDWSVGDELVPAGTLITPAVLGLAAGAGHDTLLVHRRPRVAVVVTGDELLHSGPPRPGRVRDAIGPMLPGLLTGAGAELLGTTHLRDDPHALADALAFDQADVLVTCGATSVGPADHLRRVLAELEAEILVGGVACRPGHPMLLAVLPDGRCVVGLPGNPFAALAAVLTLLRPLLDTLGGRAVRPVVTAWLGDVGAHPRDTRLVPVTRVGGEAVPVGHDRPGSLWGAALAGALAVVPPGHRGGEVELLAW